MNSICGCNVGDEGDDDDTANTVNTSINVCNIEMEDTLSNVVMTLRCHIRTELIIWI